MSGLGDAFLSRLQQLDLDYLVAAEMKQLYIPLNYTHKCLKKDSRHAGPFMDKSLNNAKSVPWQHGFLKTQGIQEVGQDLKIRCPQD
jgi:hypothetical protein